MPGTIFYEPVPPPCATQLFPTSPLDAVVQALTTVFYARNSSGVSFFAKLTGAQ